MRSDERTSVSWPSGLLALACALFLVGCATLSKGPGFEYTTATARFLLEADVRDDVASLVVLPVSGARIRIAPQAVLTEFDLLSVRVEKTEFGDALLLQMTAAASRDFHRISALNIGKKLVMLLDGQAVAARRIDGPVSNGLLYFYLETLDENLAQIATNLNGTSIEIQKRLAK